MNPPEKTVYLGILDHLILKNKATCSLGKHSQLNKEKSEKWGQQRLKQTIISPYQLVIMYRVDINLERIDKDPLGLKLECYSE